MRETVNDKGRKKLRGVSPEDIEKAKEMDLYTYLCRFEPHELVHVSGNTYCTREHDSLRISNGAWMWFSRGFGGWTALDYLIKVKGYAFVDAVNMINGQEAKVTPVFLCPKSKKRKLLLPKRHTDNKKVVAYLFKRGIDLEIISYCIKAGLIFESVPYHNAVFLGFDHEEIPRYAAYRATNGSRVLGDASGSDKRYSFRLLGKESQDIHVFESAIDLLSYATILKKKERDWKKENLLSLAGVYSTKSDGTAKVPAVLQGCLAEDEQIDTVYLHFDNDRAGRLSAEGLKNTLQNHINVIDGPPPYGKDMNDYLQQLREKESIERRSML